MKTSITFPAFRILFCLNIFGLLTALADTIVMSNSHTIEGIVIQTNEDNVLVLARYAAFNFSKTSIKEIKKDVAETATSKSGKLPDFQKAILLLSKQPWATNLTPIPATVIDKGILRNVPYTSFQCGKDYEVNIYGELDKPAGIEMGVYRALLNDNAAKSNCVKFVSELLSQSDKEILHSLDSGKDLKMSDGLTFEITPPTDEDSYHGWWVSVYSEKQLNLARASDADMRFISMTQADVKKDAEKSADYNSWSANDLTQARPSSKTIITVTTSSGQVITNAEVVRVIDGVNLIWRNGVSSGGMVKLADLPADLQNRFGYDAAKTKAAEDLAAANRDQLQQEAQANTQAALAAQAQNNYSADNYSGYAGTYSGGSYSGRGRVYVHGYTRANGTYVSPYTRSYPHSR